MNRHLKYTAKAISWRIIGSVDTFIISYIMTGKVAIAGSIAGIELFTKIGLFYMHEVAWECV